MTVVRHRMSAAFAFAAFVLAQPAAAADFQIDNFRLDLGALVISAPTLTVKGSPLEREAFTALFTGASGESAATRMGKLSATEISASQFVYEITLGPEKQTTTYRDMRFSNISNGKIGRGEAAGGTYKASGLAGPTTGAIAVSSFDDFDLRQAVRVFTERAAPGASEPMTVVLGRLEQGPQTFDGAESKVAVGKTVARNMAAKVGSVPLGEVLARLWSEASAIEKAQAAPGAEKAAAQGEASKRLGLSLLSALEMIDYGSGEMRDFAMTLTVPADAAKPKGKTAAKAETVEIKVARIAYGEDAPAKSGYAVEGLQFAGAGARGMIDSIAYSGYAFGAAIKALQEDLAKPGIDPGAIDWRRYMPTIGTLRITGLSVDAPPMAPNGSPVRVGLGTFELKAVEQLNGIPTSLAVTIDKLVAPVTEGAGNPAARDLIAMGIRSLDLSAKLDLAWEAVRNEVAIREVSFGGEGLARLNLSGTLGNVTKDLFSSDVALAQVAALGATARGLTAKLENFGLVEKLIANEARKAGRKPDEMRQQFAMIASLGLASILGPSDAAKALTAAVSRFVAQPGTLTLDARARSAGGIGLADVITLTDPTEILAKIDLKAEAR